MKDRLAGIDFGRSCAALVVYFGHLFFLALYIANNKSLYSFLSPIHNGSTAVLFFFTLSGYVLSRQTLSSPPNSRWLLARYIRLMPVYYVAFFSPMLVQIVTGNFKSDSFGVLLGVFALQSQVTKYALEINGPLWSVSVELLLSGFFMLFSRFAKSRAAYLISFILLTLSFTKLGQNPFLNGIPYFYLGVWLQSKRFSREDFLKNKVKLSNFIVSYLLISPVLLIEFNPVFKNLTNLIIFSFGIISLRNARMTNRTEKISIELGKRSYSFYCVHFPIVQLMLSWLSPASLFGFVLYVFVTTLLVGFTTEICYRLIERPAVEMARKFRSS